VTATAGAQADHRELLLQAYAAYYSQDVEALVAVISDDVDWPGDAQRVRVHACRHAARTAAPGRLGTIPRRLPTKPTRHTPRGMDDVDVFRRFHEAWTTGNLAEVLEYTDPAIVARPVHGLLFTQAEYRGHDGIAQWFDEMTGPWDSFEAIVEEVHQTADGVVGFLHLVGHRGEQAFDARVASVCQVRDGRIVALTARDIWDTKEELSRG
jgi:ketosteroid isomerase-like protein